MKTILIVFCLAAASAQHWNQQRPAPQPERYGTNDQRPAPQPAPQPQPQPQPYGGNQQQRPAQQYPSPSPKPQPYGGSQQRPAPQPQPYPQPQPQPYGGNDKRPATAQPQSYGGNDKRPATPQPQSYGGNDKRPATPQPQSYGGNDKRPATPQSYGGQDKRPATPAPQPYPQPQPYGGNQQRPAPQPQPQPYGGNQQRPAPQPYGGQDKRPATPAPQPYPQPQPYGGNQQRPAPQPQPQPYGGNQQRPAPQPYGGQDKRPATPAPQPYPQPQPYGGNQQRPAPQPQPQPYGGHQQRPAPQPQPYGGQDKRPATPAPQPYPQPQPYGGNQQRPAPQPQPQPYGGNQQRSVPQQYGSHTPAPQSYGGSQQRPAPQPQSYGGNQQRPVPPQQYGGHKPTPQPNGYGSNGGNNVGRPSIRPTQPGGNNGGGVVSGYDRKPIPDKRNAKSEGECKFEPITWMVQPQCAIANGVMFNRMTGITCEECLAECLKNQDSASPWICRAVTYDHRWHICDQFAVKGDKAPYFLTHFEGRDYFMPTGKMPTTTTTTTTTTTPKPTTTTPIPTTTTVTTTTPKPTTTTTPPSPPVCTTVNGEPAVAKFCRWEGKRLFANNDITKSAIANEADCADSCRMNMGVTCKSFDFGTSGCQLSASLASALNPDELEDAPGDGYYEKFCLPQSLSSNDDVWEVVPNHILVGHVQEVTDATSLQQCKIQCLQAQANFGFECRSGMWYPTDPDQNCLLNSETKQSQPDVFVPEDQGVTMLYFNVGRPQTIFNRRLRDQASQLTGVIDDRWTMWSKCDASVTGYQYRYLKCNENDIRRCPRQTVKCRKANRQLTGSLAGRNVPVGACLAVRDLRGRKRCPHGVRTMRNGEQKYCRAPIDC